MADKTGIEWTDASWNPVVGCSVVSPGCTNCYAMTMAGRIEAMGTAPHYAGTTQGSKAGAIWTGKLALAPDHIVIQPLRWKHPRRIFVNSMGDLFHEDVPDEWIDRVFAVMALCPQHTFQILTKRADRMRRYLGSEHAHSSDAAERIGYRIMVMMEDDDVAHPDHWSITASSLIHGPTPAIAAYPRPRRWPLPNVWLGVSAEDQRRADERIPDLLATPAALRFVSAEPLLGPIDFTHLPAGDGLMLDALSGLHSDAEEAITGVIDQPDPKLDWIIVGGESGKGARPMSIQWAREIRDQCKSAGVAFFFKQWGEWAPAGSQPSETPGRFAFGDYDHDRSRMVQIDHYPRQFTKFGARSVLEHVGKHRAGRLLDGAEHNAMPAVSHG